MAAISALAPLHLRPTRPLAAANLPPHPTPPHPPESSGSVFPPPAPCRPTDGLSSASPPPLHFLRPLVRFAVTPFCRVDGTGRRLATGRCLSLPGQASEPARRAEPRNRDPLYTSCTTCVLTQVIFGPLTVHPLSSSRTCSRRFAAFRTPPLGRPVSARRRMGGPVPSTPMLSIVGWRGFFRSVFGCSAILKV